MPSRGIKAGDTPCKWCGKPIEKNSKGEWIHTLTKGMEKWYEPGNCFTKRWHTTSDGQLEYFVWEKVRTEPESGA